MRLSFHGTLGLAFAKLYQENPHQTLRIDHSGFCNTGIGNVKVQVCMCGPGESPGASHALLWDYTTTQNQTFEAFDGLVVPESHVLWGLANSDQVIVYTISGDHV